MAKTSGKLRVPESNPDAPLHPVHELGEPFIFDPDDPHIQRMIEFGIPVEKLKELDANYRQPLTGTEKYGD